MWYNTVDMENLKQEHILVCLSASPSNARIIEIAAEMTKAFSAEFTALYVSTPAAAKMSDGDKARLERNMAFSEQMGASVTTLYGDDVGFQIAEFARLSRVTKVVLGRSSMKRRLFGSKPLTEQLTAIAPDIEVHIIPDHAAETKYKRKNNGFAQSIPGWKDILITLAVLAVATGVGMLFSYLHLTEANIITMYVLGVLVTAIFTRNYVCNVVCAIVSVLVFNLLFVEPHYSLRVNDVSTYVTFAIMLIASLIMGAVAHRMRYTAKKSAQSAYRTKVLFDTDRLLQQQTEESKLLATAAEQLVQLTGRDVAVYTVDKGEPVFEEIFKAENSDGQPFDAEVVRKLLQADMPNGLQENGAIYFTVSIDKRVYGAVGVSVGDKKLDPLEKSILQSIVGECALTIDNVKARAEKERVSVKARQEQLRANMLRSISHDLRTPLTSIAGNADCLLNSYDKLDDDTRRQLLSDICEDSMWLYGIVENLLSVTRLNSEVKLNLTCELADELIDEAVRRLHRRIAGRKIVRVVPDQPLVVKVDTKLFIQVLVNLLDNALKYTPSDSELVISAEKADGVRFSVADNGAGIPDDLKEKVFDMFYTGDNSVADGRRSLGLGLALCKSILKAHGSDLTVSDNTPSGAVFSFTLPEEVSVNE